MLALLALLFSRPFMSRPAGTSTGKKLVVVAIDRSFSMRAGDHLAEAKRQALAAVDRIRGGDLGQVVAVGSRVETMTEPVNDPGVLKAAVNSVTAGDEASSYAEFSRFIRGLPAALKMPVDAQFFTDAQQSSMPSAFADLALREGVRLSVHPVGSAAPNWAVESVTAPNAVYGSGKVRLSAVVAGYGTPAARRTVSLVVNGRAIESKPADVPANGRASVEFAGFEPTYRFNRA